jgi:hypothetical protein
MNIRFVDAQNDQNSFAPHIIIIRDNSTGNVLYEYYAQPDSGNSGGFNLTTIPDNTVLNIELINPNVFESVVNRNYLWYNQQANGFVPVNTVVSVPQGHSNIIIIDGSDINNNLTLETTNNGINPSNILYSVVGETPISGTDLDGNTLANNENIFSVLRYKKLSDNTLSTFTIDNKKLRHGSPNGALIDDSSYVPYLPKFTVAVTNDAPIISLYNNDTIEWTNPPTPKSSVKKVKIFNNDILFNTLDVTTPDLLTSILLSDLQVGNFKIQYSVDSGNTYGAFSNIIALNPTVSATPSVTSSTGTLDSNGNSVINIHATPNSDAYQVFNDGVQVKLANKFASNGTLSVTVTQAGNYKFVSKETGKTRSVNSNSAVITTYNSTCIGITNIVINSKDGGETPYSSRTIGVNFSGSQPNYFNWSISGQGTSIISGASTQSPEFQFGNSNGTITFSGVDCQGIAFSQDYVFSLNNLVLPHIIKIDEITFNWDNDVDNTDHSKTVRLYDNTGYLLAERVNQSGSDNIILTRAGSYKITYSKNGTDFSAFSNILSFAPSKTDTPIVTSNPANGQISTDGTQAVVFTFSNFVTGSRVYIYKNNVFVTDVGVNTYSTNQVGNYTFLMQTPNLLASDKTSVKTVSYIPTTNSCNTDTPFSILNIDYTNSSKSLNVTVNASSLTSATWSLKLGNTVIDSGNILISSNPTTIQLASYLTNNTYELTLSGTSCTGVAVKAFNVTNFATGCSLSFLELSQNTDTRNLIDITFNCSKQLTSLQYDLLDSNSVLVLANQVATVPILISNTHYKSQLDFINVTEGVYKVKIKNNENGDSCSVTSDFIFSLSDTDLTTGVLLGTQCDFNNLTMSQNVNSNIVTASFVSLLKIDSLTFDLLDVNDVIISADNLVNIVSDIFNTYNITFDLGKFITGSYKVRIKSNICDITSLFSFIKYVAPLAKSPTPVITYDYVNSRIIFSYDFSGGVINVYKNNDSVLISPDKTVISNNNTYNISTVNLDTLKIKVTLPDKSISEFSNTLTISKDVIITCVPIAKTVSSIITGTDKLLQNSQGTYSIDLSTFTGTLPF